MHVTVISLVTSEGGVGRILQVNEDQSRLELGSTGGRADRYGVVFGGIDNDVVCASNGQALPECLEVSNRVESFGLLLLSDLENLVEVEDLDVMVLCFGPDDEQIVQHPKF